MIKEKTLCYKTCDRGVNLAAEKDIYELFLMTYWCVSLLVFSLKKSSISSQFEL